MIWDRDDLKPELVDMYYADETAPHTVRCALSCCALSLRFESQTQIKTATQTLSLQARDLTFFPPQLPYVRRTTRDRIIVFHFKLPFEVPPQIEVLRGTDFSVMAPLFEEAYQQFLLKPPGWRYSVTAILYRVLAEIRITQSGGMRHSSTVAATLEELVRRLGDSDLSVKSLAETAHVSESYLRRLFVRELGVSPKGYILRLRLSYARSLLQAGNYTVGQAAEMAGFSDAKNFATAYKKQFGLPPTADTKRHCKTK